MTQDIKPMSVAEMTLALDRISRFKFPENKLKRVYVETICAHYLKSKGKKVEIENLDYKSLKEMFEEIWNYSIVSNFGSKSNDFTLNENFVSEEVKCYYLSDMIMDLMPSGADFMTLLNNIKIVPNGFDKYLTPKKLVLTEGITEELLLPEFSKIIGYDWAENGVKIVGTGGKSRVINLYNIYKKQVKVPIFILLDADAKSVYDRLKNILRTSDIIHIIKSGEIEDIIPVTLFKRAINAEFKNQAKISVSDFDKNLSMVENLHTIFKNKGFGEFKKAKTAKMISQNLTKKEVLSEELIQILSGIKAL